jgi:hypothetical protein
MVEAQDDGIRIPIEHVIPDSVRTKFADRIVVQHSEHEFRISFYEMHQPILLGTPEERKARLLGMESVKAVCVARIAVAAGRMPAMVRALQENLERYLSEASSQEEE